MTLPLDAVAVAETRRLTIPFDWRIAGVTLLPWALVLGFALLGSTPAPLVIGVTLLGAPHILATVGLFAERGLRDHVLANRTAFVVVPLAAIAASTVAFALSPRQVVGVLIVGFLLWQTHHFTKQNMGLFVFWAKARGLSAASTVERKLIMATSIIGMTGILRLWDPGSWLDGAMRAIGLVAIVGCAGVALLCRAEPRRRAALLVAVAFYAPLHLYEPGVLAASASYQVAHGAQYFLMVATATRPTVRALTAFLLLFSIGSLAVISVGGVDPYGSAAWAFGFYKGVIAGHFLVDARFWRLRDAPVRTFMKERFAFL